MSVTTLSDKVKFIESAFGSGKLARNEKNIDIRCPMCAPRDPSKRKLAIRVDDDRNHCWTCGWRARTLAPLLAKYASREKLQEYITKFLPKENINKHFLESALDKQNKVQLPNDFRLLATLENTDPDTCAIKQYLTHRGLSERDLWYFRIGVSDEPRWKRRAIVPSFDGEGEVNYFVARTIDKKRNPKYDNPDIDSKLHIIFNEMNVDWTSRLVLCEGSFDMFKCGDNVVPLLGSTLNEESALFNSILINSTPIAIALDADMWFTKTPKIAKKLAEYDVDVTIVDTRSFTDPGSATKDQFKEALSVAKPFSWFDTFQNKLNHAAGMSLSSHNSYGNATVNHIRK